MLSEKCVTCVYCKQPIDGKRATYACFINPNPLKRIRKSDNACKKYVKNKLIYHDVETVTES